MAKDNLHPLVRDIQEKIVGLRDDLKSLLGEVRKVRTTVEEGVESVRAAIDDNIQAQAELKIMDKVASVNSIPAQIEAERDQIDAEKQELEAKLEQIGERYRRRHRELDERAETRIREVGSHIFEIEEEEYEHNVERPFHDHVTETWREMQAVSTEIGRDHVEGLESELEATHESIDDLLARRDQFLADIERSRVRVGDTFASPQRVQVPFWVVTVDVDGERVQRVVGPADLSRRDDAYYGVELRERPGLAPLVEQVAQATSPGTTARYQFAGDTVGEVVEGYAGESVAGQYDFADALEGAVGEAVPVSVEGGDGS